LENLPKEKQFGGLRVDAFETAVIGYEFKVVWNTFGLTGFTFEQYPIIQGKFIEDSPTTVNLKFIPNYIMIVFFFIVATCFLYASIFLPKMTINDVLRVPTIFERILFVCIGCIVPLLWCFFGYIRPIKKAETWILERLNLKRLN
jgi:hypothetical protein